MNNSIKRIITLTKRNVKEIIRDPLSLVFLIGLPLVMEILFYLIFHKYTAQFEMKYLAPGIVVFSESFLSLFAGLLISLDRSSSFLTRLYVSKAKSFEFILSYAISLIPLIIVQTILFFLVGGVIDSSIFSVGMILCLLISVITSQFFIGFGILLGSVCNEKSIGGVASIVIAGQSILSGMWFPTEGLDGAMITIMKSLPFKNATDLMQNMLNGINDFSKDFLIPLLILLGYTIAIFVLAIILFKNKMKAK